MKINRKEETLRGNWTNLDTLYHTAYKTLQKWIGELHYTGHKTFEEWIDHLKDILLSLKRSDVHILDDEQKACKHYFIQLTSHSSKD